MTKGIGENDNEESLQIPYQTSPLEGARILVLAAHPDDEVLGAGGTLALNANRAEAIRVWVATDGQKQERVAGSDEEYGARRREESRRAARVLGIAEPVFGAMPDRELASRREELRAELLTQVRDFSPDLILCPSPVEIHPDHRALAETLYELVAGSRLADADHDRLRLTRIGFYELTHPLLPNTLVDIASVAAIKREALGAFVSQQQVRDYAGAIDGLNVYRRLTVPGAGPAEAFRVIAQAEAVDAFSRGVPALHRAFGRHGRRAGSGAGFRRRADSQPARSAAGGARQPALSDGSSARSGRGQRRRRLSGRARLVLSRCLLRRGRRRARATRTFGRGQSGARARDERSRGLSRRR